MSALAAESSMPSRHSTRRWVVALVATALLVVSGSGLVAFAQTSAAASRGPVFVPADASLYLGARLDMPDGQADALAEFMTAFPGFTDTGTFEMKVGETVDGLLAQATDGAITDADELFTFMTGEVGLAVSDLAEAAMGGGEPPILVGVAVTDRAPAEAFVESLVAGLFGEPFDETYGDARVLGVEGTAVAVTDEWVLLSPFVEDVHAALDVLAGEAPSLAEDPGFSEAFARVPSAHLASVYMDLSSFGSLIDLAGAATAGQAGVEFPTEQLMAQMPLDMMAYLAAGSDRLTLEAFITPGEATPSLPTGESDLATLFPADTQVYLETRELGATLENVLSAIFATMGEDTAAELAPFEDMLGTPLPSFFDFVSDAAVGGGLSSDGLWLGIGAEVSDDETAAARVERILSIVRLLASDVAGEDAPAIDIETQTIGEAEVTVITLPLEEAAASLPIDIGDTISITLSDGTLLIGTGDFVENALAESGADSLAESAGYVDALGDATSNSGVLFVNVGSLLAVLDPLLSEMTPQWADIQPYATAIDRFVVVGGGGDDLITAKMSVIVAP